MRSPKSKIRAYVVSEAGKREVIEASFLLLDLGEGREVKVSCNSGIPGRFTLTAGVSGIRDVFRGGPSCFSILPGAANVLHITLHRPGASGRGEG